MNQLNETTRCFARTLREIDPVLYRSSIEHFEGHGVKLVDLAINACYVLALLVVVASIFFWGAP